jgi:ATP-dependent RNA helicase DDX47/RRP3
LAQTGSGKTGAFALPILQQLKLNDSQARAPGVYALVLVPSRELAFQIEKVFKTLGSALGALKCATIVGGMDVVLQAAALAKRPHIVVATPGRLLHHLENTKGFSVAGCKYLVLDEADRLLNMDFEDEVDRIMGFMPQNRHTFLFSATMTSKVNKLERASLMNPVKVQVSAKYEAVSTLDQRYLFVPAKYKDCYLVYILNDIQSQQCIVFTDTVLNAQRVAITLRTLGFKAVPLHGKMSQEKRLAALAKFVARTNNILVATDVASR